MVSRLLVAAIWLCIALIAGCAHAPGQGWIVLIDAEEGLENFLRVGDANWRAEGGAVVADRGDGGYLVSRDSYQDFEIYAEFWADADTNSGIFLRVSDPQNITPYHAYEANIYDRRPDPKYGTGAIVDVARVNPMPRAGGKWNTYEIYAKGTEITLKLNGQVTVSANDGRFVSGPLALQYGGHGKAPGGAIKWRKVMVRPL